MGWQTSRAAAFGRCHRPGEEVEALVVESMDHGLVRLLVDGFLLVAEVSGVPGRRLRLRVEAVEPHVVLRDLDAPPRAPACPRMDLRV